MDNLIYQMKDAFAYNPTNFIVLVVTFSLLVIMGYEYKTMKNNQVNRLVSTRIGKTDASNKLDFVDLFTRLFQKQEMKIHDQLRKANVLFTTKEYMTFMAIGLIGGLFIGLAISPLGVIFKTILYTASFATQELLARGLTGALFGFLGSQFPRLWLMWLIHRRRKLLDDQLQDALLNIADALKSGHVIQEAIRIVGDEMPYPIGPEFEKTYREMETGKTLEAALGDLKKRIDLPDFTMAVNAIEIQYEVGGKLEPLLRNMVKIIVERGELKKEIEKTIASSKTVGYVLLAAPWFFIVIFTMMNKETYIAMLKNPIGIIMLLIALVCYGIAAWFIIYIIRDVSKDAQ